MAMPIIPLPKFPSVPNVAGVPAMLRDPLAAITTLAAPVISGFLGQFTPVWGVFDSSGKAIITPDTFLGIDYENARRIANFPVEQGSFATYNKVNDPFTATVRMAVGGTVAQRNAFLQALEMLSDSTALYTLVTPEASYKNVNMERYDYRRDSRNGAGMIVASCRFLEVRTATTAYSGQSAVPATQINSANTSTGLPNATATTDPAATAQVSAGSVTPQMCTRPANAATF